jgi:hypothetical protein
MIVNGTKEVYSADDIKPTAQISTCVLDKAVDVNLVKHFIDVNAFSELTKRIADKSNTNYTCSTCEGDLSDVRSVGCDACLHWQHYSCAGIKTEPKLKYWFCKNCK